MIPPEARGEGVVADGDGDTDGDRVVLSDPPALPTVAVPDVVEEQAVANMARTRTAASLLRLALEGGFRTMRKRYKPPMPEPCQAFGSALGVRHEV